MKTKILYIEDEVDLGNVTRQYLELMDFDVEWCTSGKSALTLFNADPYGYQLMIIDIQLPNMNGFELAERILHINEEAYFLFLSARKEKSDRLKGLKIGAVDYITKPFDIDELVLRIQNIIKRQKQTPMSIIQKSQSSPLVNIGDMQLNKDLLTLTLIKDKSIVLTQREAELLEYLNNHQNIIIKRADILMQVWGENDYFLGRSLDVFISRLRKLLRSSSNVKIDNVYGVGFIFSVKAMD
ncbi:response regulator transcription factor [Pedobacter nyackensis]|uniref:response regulator transcription factor n=1 Tax=Pedobacter nyackensis TaxID=475255 RepID=UPI00292DE3C3|nr:response regulator transcription factor [Pedobacter nyackensis]